MIKLQEETNGIRQVLTLPFPPSANRYWRFPRGLGYPLVSRDARAYKKLAAAKALQQGITPIDGDVQVRIYAFRPSRRGDIDNMLKVALDSLKGIAWKDDSQISFLTVVRFEDKANPRLEIEFANIQWRQRKPVVDYGFY